MVYYATSEVNCSLTIFEPYRSFFLETFLKVSNNAIFREYFNILYIFDSLAHMRLVKEDLHVSAHIMWCLNIAPNLEMIIDRLLIHYLF